MASWLRWACAWLIPLWLHRWYAGWLRTYCLNHDRYDWRWRHRHPRGCSGVLVIEEQEPALRDALTRLAERLTGG